MAGLPILLSIRLEGTCIKMYLGSRVSILVYQEHHLLSNSPNEKNADSGLSRVSIPWNPLGRHHFGTHRELSSIFIHI